MRIFHALNADADYENLSIDSASIKAHPHSAGAKKRLNSENNQFIGTSRSGKTTKIHAVVDALGNPLHFMLTGVQVHDATAAISLLISWLPLSLRLFILLQFGFWQNSSKGETFQIRPSLNHIFLNYLLK